MHDVNEMVETFAICTVRKTTLQHSVISLHKQRITVQDCGEIKEGLA